MPRPTYHGKDFFQRPQFRGLLLADHQEALGERAFRCVDSLNADTVSKFNEIESFRQEISIKREQQSYYKEVTKVKPFVRAGANNSFMKKPTTTVPGRRSPRLDEFTMHNGSMGHENEQSFYQERAGPAG